jgi:GDPmannose 4,6-dehydratase
LQKTFEVAGLNVDEHVRINPRLFRPHEVPHLEGDASKAKKVLGWKPKVSFEQLVEMMYREDFDSALKL